MRAQAARIDERGGDGRVGDELDRQAHAARELGQGLAAVATERALPRAADGDGDHRHLSARDDALDAGAKHA